MFGSAPHIGVFGTSTGTEGFSGVHGESIGGPGVSATSVGSVGIDAKTQTGPAAVRAISAGNGHGVLGSAPHVGVFGVSTGTGGFSGVHGESTGGPGVSGTSVGSVGVDARTDHGPAALRAVPNPVVVRAGSIVRNEESSERIHRVHIMWRAAPFVVPSSPRTGRTAVGQRATVNARDV